MEFRTFAGVALDPDFSAHQLGQPFADRQPQARAPIMTRGRGIDLLKRFEKPVLPIQRNSDACVAHEEMQQPLLRVPKKISVMLVAGFKTPGAFCRRSYFNDHLALMRELHRVSD